MSARLLKLDYAVAEMRAVFQRESGKRDNLKTRNEALLTELGLARRDIADWDLVVQLLTLTSESQREQIRRRIEQTVTAALQTVFGDHLRFCVSLGTMGGQPVAEFAVTTLYGDLELTTSVEDSRGGGVVDVVSLALRLAVLELYRPKIGGALVLDEPGRHVSAEYALNLARFLKGYSQETGRQVLMVTHQTALAHIADKSFWVALRSGTSEVKSA
jgi:DNA repair ATPase RecN